MSTFLGQISEIPGISVDRFNGANLNSSVYFLSHCHTDHMEGLGDGFFSSLIKRDKYLYCSPISKAFLLGIFPGAIEDRIKELELAMPTAIDYEVSSGGGKNLATSITVTTSPAGHCPGSVMFVFTRGEETILYTGDFRVDPSDFARLNPLNDKIDGKNRAKKFTAVYLDTTFLSSDFPRFPSRKKSGEEIHDAVKNWLESDPKNAVILECSGLYGAEYLFMEVSKLLKTKIHVKDKVYSNYSRMGELAKCVTSDGTSSRIHACNSKFSGQSLKCRSDVHPQNILTVVPSVQRWRGKSGPRFAEYDPANRQRFYVCYSMHASYEELKAFVEYFKPDKIVPCVCPDESINEIYQLIRKLMAYQRKPEAKKVCRDFKLTAEPLIARKVASTFVSKFFTESDDDDC